MRPAILMCVTFAAVAACGGSGSSATGPQATATQASQPQATATQASQPQATPTQPPAGGSGTSVAHLEVKGGKLAGTYDSTGIKVDCNWRDTVSAADYQDLDKATGMDGLSFVSGEPGANPTKFAFLALFAPFAVYQDTLEIDTLVATDLRGSGTSQLDDKGATIKWSVEGKTADGIGLKGFIECGPVDRP